MGRFDQGMTGTVLGAVAACIVEPFYVACGFTLYLQRRTILEGWDIELRFRQLTERVEKARRSATALAGERRSRRRPRGDGRAAARVRTTAGDGPAAAPKASEEIREVMKDPEFGRKGTRTRVRYVGPEFEGKRDAKPFDWSWLAKLTQWMGELSRAAAWVRGGAGTRLRPLLPRALPAPAPLRQPRAAPARFPLRARRALRVAAR